MLLDIYLPQPASAAPSSKVYIFRDSITSKKLFDKFFNF